MDILVYGAGVVGSVYAARLKQVAQEIMAQLHSSPLATPTLNRLMVILEQTPHEL